jgi:hypothetical protein
MPGAAVTPSGEPPACRRDLHRGDDPARRHRDTPTGKAFDVEFGQTTKWDCDQLIVISFYDSALQRRQIGLATVGP